MDMDTLTLKSLSFKAFHGYYEEERQQGNHFEIDLVFRTNLRPAGKSDRLEDTIDYQKATDIVREVMEGPSQKLIETLTKHIGDRLFAAFPRAEQLEVAVRKLAPPLDIETTYSETRMSWQRSS
ncbi:dihydroneopterin aldolase [Fodinibius sediminis]|uniref:7,8-dihydroneopterin aldolase n=1 Tax=Fodinibius sediminis TaxID=1214077 RepID=A0A521CMU2_9BACT|nr:dihydroneopterin aldolase [Fodinibius sediminis]SMO60695.1 dihydroneopterin aldolase [Fodinibius sediminis]